MKKVSDIVIDFLLSKKINDALTISGGGCIHLIDSLNKYQDRINTYCFHHEQALAMAAEGYYRQSNNLCCSIVTTGPGGTNTITGLLGMWLDSIPGLFISGQVSRSQLSTGTGCRQIGDQEFDIVKLVSSITKYSVLITKPEDILYELEKAYKISLDGRPGPVWIDIPLDVQGYMVDETLLKKYIDNDSKQEIDKRDISSLIELIKISKKPLVITGNGICLSNTSDELLQFLNKFKLPIVTGPHSGIDCIDNTYEHYMGRIGILGQLTSNQIVQEADLLICLGSRLPVKMTGYNIKTFSPNSKKVIVDIDNNEINKHLFDVELKIVGNLKDFFDLINSTTESFEEKTNWLYEIHEIRKNQIYSYPKHKKIKNYASFYELIYQAKDIWDKESIVTSNGSAHVITLQTYQLNSKQKLFTNVGCASMGYGLPASIGACISNNKSPTICIEGDGSIMMNLQDLQTIKHYNLPICILLINNDGYLSIKLTQEAFFKGSEFASGPENGVTLPKFKDICNAFNIKHFSIRSNDEITACLKEAKSYHNPCLIEIFTHPKERHEPKVTHKGIDNNGNIIPGSLTDMYISENF
jgi:acetolactate synthase-1/2/3 large subunit